MVRRSGVVLAVVVALGLGRPAGAQEAPGPHREGEYGGIRPGEAPAQDDKEPKDASNKGRKKVAPDTLTWIGFRPVDGGGAEIFFQTTSRMTATQRVEGGALVVRIEGVRRMAPNTRRPLDTRFFETPIARLGARLVPARRGRKKAAARKAGVEVRIAFKNPSDAREGALRLATEPDGRYYVYLDVAPAAGKTAAEKTPDEKTETSAGE